MGRRALGQTGLNVSCIGLGGMPMSISGRPSEDDSVRVIHAALDHGMTFIDTADVYCLDHTDIGHNERVIARALRDRRLLGGGMRQVGILAAAGLYALDHHVARLVEDHETAHRLAAGLQEIPDVSFPLGRPETNIVIFDISGTKIPADDVANRLKEERVLVHAISPRQIRAVTHLDITSADVDQALDSLWTVLNGRRKR